MVGQPWIMEVGCPCQQHTGDGIGIGDTAALAIVLGGSALVVGLPVLVAWWLGASPWVLGAIGVGAAGTVWWFWTTQQ